MKFFLGPKVVFWIGLKFEKSVSPSKISPNRVDVTGNGHNLALFIDPEVIDQTKEAPDATLCCCRGTIQYEVLDGHVDTSKFKKDSKNQTKNTLGGTAYFTLGDEFVLEVLRASDLKINKIYYQTSYAKPVHATGCFGVEIRSGWVPDVDFAGQSFKLENTDDGATITVTAEPNPYS